MPNNEEMDEDDKFIDYFENVVEECGQESYRFGFSYEEVFSTEDPHYDQDEIGQAEYVVFDYEKTVPLKYDDLLNVERPIRIMALSVLFVVLLLPSVSWLTQINSDHPYIVSNDEITRIIAVAAFTLGVYARLIVEFILDFIDAAYSSFCLYRIRKRSSKISRLVNRYSKKGKHRKKATKVYPPS